MKIIMINSSGRWGGAEKIFLLSAMTLNQKNNVTCFLGTKGKLYDKLNSNGINVILFELNYSSINENTSIIFGKRFLNIKNIIENNNKFKSKNKTLIKRILDISPDLIFLNNLRALLLFNGIRKSLNFKYKTIWHEHNFQRSTLRQLYLDFILLKYIDKIFCVSNKVRNFHNIVVKKKSVVIHNGIEIPKITNLKKERKISENFIFLHPAYIRRWKGQHVVLKAMKKLNENGIKNYKVLFVGEHSENNQEKKYFMELKEYVLKNKLDKNLSFLGFRDDLFDIMSNSDCVISSSIEHDAFPTILLEASALKKCIISSDSGGCKEIIKNNENGIIYKRNKSLDLFISMKFVIENPIQRKEFEKKAYNNFINKLSIKIFENKLIKNIVKVVK